MTIREHIAFRNIFFLDTCDDVQSIGVDKEGRLISIESSEGRDYQRIFAVVEASISATERMLPLHPKVQFNRAKLRELAHPPALGHIGEIMAIREHIAFRNIFFLDICDDSQSIGVDKEGRLITIESSQDRNYQRVFEVIEASILATERMLPIRPKVQFNRAKLRELAHPPAAVGLEVGVGVSAGAGTHSHRPTHKKRSIEDPIAPISIEEIEKKVSDLFDGLTTPSFNRDIAIFLHTHSQEEIIRFLEALDALCGGPFFAEDDVIEMLYRIATICFSDSNENKLKFKVIQEFKETFNRRTFSPQKLDEFCFFLEENIDMVESCADCFLDHMVELKECARLLARIKDKESHCPARVFYLLHEIAKKPKELVSLLEKLIPHLETRDKEPSMILQKLLSRYQGLKK